ncbi:MAG: hypothetical protein ACW99Q_09935 [Candidatus Kariarchaeaceae archaeon]
MNETNENSYIKNSIPKTNWLQLGISILFIFGPVIYLMREDPLGNSDSSNIFVRLHQDSYFGIYIFLIITLVVLFIVLTELLKLLHPRKTK